MKSILNGIYAGWIATGPMTVLMFASEHQLPKSERSPLPPATLSHQSGKKVGIHIQNPELSSLATMVSHFAYGAAMGAIYQALPVKKSAATGVVFGLGVWGVSYGILSPALGFRAQAPNMPEKRNGMMILAHVLWGATLGYTAQKLSENSDEMLNGNRKAPAAE